MWEQAATTCEGHDVKSLDDVRPKWGTLDLPTREFQAREFPLQGGVLIHETRELIGCGWPTLALWCEPRYDSRKWPPTQLATRGFIELWRSPRANEGVPRVLPLIPIWPDFAINTFFYAAILWRLLPGPFVLRRFVRVRRGLCPKCAYPMGDSAVCTECGEDLPKRVRQAT